MLFNQFPDLQWLKNNAESRFLNRRSWSGESLSTPGWPTVILQVKARETYRDNIPGPLSLFSNFSGESAVSVEGRKTNIPSGCFFLSNAGQRYTLEIGRNQSTETFNIHFGESWAEEVLVSLHENTGTLLDRPDKAQNCEVLFTNKLFRKDEVVLQSFNQLVNGKDQGQLKRDEVLYGLLAHLVKENVITRTRMNSLASSRVSTRKEIMKRLHLATDYVYNYYHQNISLDELASVSMMSKFHFLRSFREAFHKTPHQFVTGLRIEKAKEMLTLSDVEVRWIGKTLGFDSASSFSRAFHQQVSIYPTQFREMFRN